MEEIIILGAASLAFLLSASAGLGGSLILVPILALLLGAKEGIALAGLLLAANNVAKTLFYRHTIPWRASMGVLAAILIGVAVGSVLLVHAPDTLVDIVVATCLVAAFAFERLEMATIKRRFAPLLAFGAGITSGFSGTSGPMKGIALRSLGFDRLYFVGAASIVSLGGDVVKSAIFAKAQLLTAASLNLFLMAVPIMFISSYLGKRLNATLGERAFSTLFWAVMGGYAVRLALV